jgi:hypothetical protein
MDEPFSSAHHQLGVPAEDKCRPTYTTSTSCRSCCCSNYIFTLHGRLRARLTDTVATTITLARTNAEDDRMSEDTGGDNKRNRTKEIQVVHQTLRGLMRGELWGKSGNRTNHLEIPHETVWCFCHSCLQRFSVGETKMSTLGETHSN